MIGTDRLLPPGHWIPRPGRIQIKIGKPLMFDELAGQPVGNRQRRAVTDQVIEAIRELSGQDYVPVYASARKEELAAAKASAHRRAGGAPG
jgi:1-acyl-sn-glycerol-3-phosphate acyltransferase